MLTLSTLNNNIIISVLVGVFGQGAQGSRMVGVGRGEGGGSRFPSTARLIFQQTVEVPILTPCERGPFPATGKVPTGAAAGGLPSRQACGRWGAGRLRDADRDQRRGERSTRAGRSR